ncbi:MAG: PIN domain-containing protein [Chloroflexi bacterium]|nr:PIN domain-containing protein [Chloroflexota bacterium]
MRGILTAANHDIMVVPDIVLPELGYLFRRDFGYAGVQALLERINAYEVPFERLTRSDLARMLEIATSYSSAEFDIVDCCIMAIAERLDINRIATFDRRDFSIFRPAHCKFFELLPSV